MALSPQRGRSGYNNTQQGKRNVLQSKASQEKRPALGLGGGGLCQDQNPRESQGPGQKYPSQFWGALLWEFTTVKSVQTEPLEVYRDLTFMGSGLGYTSGNCRDAQHSSSQLPGTFTTTSGRALATGFSKG